MTRKEFLIIAIATLITVVAWVIFDIIHKRSQISVSPKLQEVIEPLNPNFDLEGV